MDESDELLAKKVQAGDTAAFGILVDRYGDKITRYASRYLFDKEDVVDEVQEVFLKAFTNINSFDAERKFSPWLYRLAHNEFVNHLKRKKLAPLLFDLDADVFLPSLVAPERTEAESEQRIDKEAMDKCLRKLPEKDREILILFFYEEQSYKDISDILHIPISTVGVRLSRAKERLKKNCDQYGKE